MKKILLITIALLFATQVYASEEELFISIGQNNLSEVVRLIKLGENVNAHDENGTTALMGAAAINPNADIIKTLIEHGADIHTKNNEGKNALDYAEKNKNPSIYLLLRQYYNK